MLGDGYDGMKERDWDSGIQGLGLMMEQVWKTKLLERFLSHSALRLISTTMQRLRRHQYGGSTDMNHRKWAQEYGIYLSSTGNCGIKMRTEIRTPNVDKLKGRVRLINTGNSITDC